MNIFKLFGKSTSNRQIRIFYYFLLLAMIILGASLSLARFHSVKNSIQDAVALETKAHASMITGTALLDLLENPNSSHSIHYLSIKNRLVAETGLNPDVYKAYIWTLRDNHLFSVADSSIIGSVDYLPPNVKFSGPNSQTINDYLSGNTFVLIADDNDSIKTITISTPIRDPFTNKVIAYYALSFYYAGFHSQAVDEALDIALLFTGLILAFTIYYVFYLNHSKLKHSKELIRKGHQRYAELARESNTLTWELDKNKIFTFVSENAYKFLGYTAHELIGNKTFPDLLLNSEDPKFNQNLSSLLDYSARLLKMPLTLKSKTNDYTFTTTTIVPLFDSKNNVLGYQGICHDITQIEMTRRALRHEKELANKYLNLAGVMILVLNREGIITLINKRGCDILGADEKDILGKNWISNFILPNLRSKIQEVFDAIVFEGYNPKKTYENYIVNAQGQHLLIAWENSLLYDAAGKLSGVISSGEDITERRADKEKLIKLSYTDALTQLHNRRYYIENIPRFDVENNYPLTVVMGDINGLKLINDAFGHDAGDNLLINAANLIKQFCKKDYLAARIGGDEFVIFMPKTNAKEAETFVNEIKKNAKLLSTQSIGLSISFGCKTKTHLNENIHDILKSAEDVMYQDKLLESNSMRSGAIDTILRILYEKDKNSEKHCRDVALISTRIAKALGMNESDINEIEKAALLHDIGKIVISSPILDKPGKLTFDEYESIKSHCEVGFRILSSMQDLRNVATIVLNHHERWDGDGYPRGISGKSIPLKSRIISVADAYDAMTSERTYKKVFSKKEALDEVILNSGTQFDPNLVKVFKDNFSKIILESS